MWGRRQTNQLYRKSAKAKGEEEDKVKEAGGEEKGRAFCFGELEPRAFLPWLVDDKSH